jgi:hypothetical protein
MNEHIINGDLDMLLGEAKYLPWSASRVDAACSCLYKFHKIYMEGCKESSPALTLGSLTHEILAKAITDGKPSMLKAQSWLRKSYELYRDNDPTGAVLAEVEEFLPYIITFTDNWKNFLQREGISEDFVEQPYGVTQRCSKASYLPDDSNSTYFRGIIDLWAYDPVKHVLYIVDHKTNKSAASKQKVKEHSQLNLYTIMLVSIFQLPWTKAVVGLNFVRKGKVVWNTIYPSEAEEFRDKYWNTLKYLEYKLWKAESDMVWPATRSFKCNWCTFKNSCNSYLNKV